MSADSEAPPPGTHFQQTYYVPESPPAIAYMIPGPAYERLQNRIRTESGRIAASAWLVSRGVSCLTV